MQNHREPPCKLCLEKACLLCHPPSSSLVLGTFSHGSRLWTFTWSKPASGPEFPAPLNPMHPFSLYAPPQFPRNQPVLATYSGQYMYLLSLSCSFLLPPPNPSLGLITW